MDLERPFKCKFPKCDKSYGKNAHLKRHMEVHSLIATNYSCQLCSASMSTKSNLKRHYSRAHNPNKLRCQECNLSFRKKNTFEDHMASHENSVLYKCDKCEKKFINHLRLKKHQLCHEPKHHKCKYQGCSQIFDTIFLLRAHQNECHIEFSCPHCEKKFSKIYFKSHLKIHKKDRPALPCPYENCNRLYYFRKNLKQHIKSTHTGNKFQCDICKRKLSTKQKIKEHIFKIHLSEKKPFKRKTQLPRKDIGLAKKSVLSELTGIQLSVNAEVLLMQRTSAALQRDKMIEESSFSEDSDVSTKNTWC